MPHIEIKAFPRDFTDEQQTALARALTEVLEQHMQSKESAVSIALKHIPQAEWKSRVWDTQIAPEMDELIKKPGYSM